MAIVVFILALLGALHHTPGEHNHAHGPVVVELFTSQGCPMCPDANRFLAELDQEGEEVLALAYGVSYWDMYGWEDRFAQPEFTERQQAYVDFGEAKRVYTPHFVINGAPTKFRFRPAVICAAAEAAPPTPLYPMVTREADGSVTVTIDGPAREHPAQMWLAAYQPGLVTMQIESGRNAGLVMPHYNMVRDLTALPDWQGGAYEARHETACPPDLACAILVQSARGGPILGAGSIPPEAG